MAQLVDARASLAVVRWIPGRDGLVLSGEPDGYLQCTPWAVTMDPNGP